MQEDQEFEVSLGYVGSDPDSEGKEKKISHMDILVTRCFWVVHVNYLVQLFFF